MKTKIREWASPVCIVLGAILIALSVWTTIQDERAEAYAGERSEYINAEAARLISDSVAVYEDYSDCEVVPDYVLDPGREMPSVEIDGTSVIGQVSVPSVGIELPVCAEWDLTDAKSAPCRYVGSVYDDTMIIAGHSYKAHFRGLYDVKTGADVTFTDMDGNTFQYRVSKVETLDEYDHDGLLSGDWDMTLFTCTSDSRHRVTVRCDLIESERGL